METAFNVAVIFIITTQIKSCPHYAG